MAYEKKKSLIIQDTRIIFRNFQGRPTKYNHEGDRNFCIIIDDSEQAQQLAEDGWNIHILPVRDEGDEPTHYLPVKVSFEAKGSNKPAEIHLVTRKKQTLLDEENVGNLDFAEIINVDATINPSFYIDRNSGERKISAYLKSMWVTIEEDVFADKYASYMSEDEPEDVPFE